MKRGGIKLTILSPSTQFKLNHTSLHYLRSNGNHRRLHHRHSPRGHPCKSHSLPQRFSSRRILLHDHTEKNTGKLEKFLRTPPCTCITIWRTKAMKRIRRRCLQNLVKPSSKKTSALIQFPVDGKRGVPEANGVDILWFIKMYFFQKTRQRECWLLFTILMNISMILCFENKTCRRSECNWLGLGRL